MTRVMTLGAAIGCVVLMAACGSGTCNSTNCSGCCTSSGVCETGNTVSACGKAGTTCAVCGNSEACSSSGTCSGVDPNSTWRVQPASATVKNNNNGGQWDGDDSAPDVKVEIFCPANATSVSGTTETKDDTYSPTWSNGGCVLKASELISGGFAYQVKDVDAFGVEEPVTGKITVNVTEADLSAGVSNATASDGLSALRISLQRQ